MQAGRLDGDRGVILGNALPAWGEAGMPRIAPLNWRFASTS